MSAGVLRVCGGEGREERESRMETLARREGEGRGNNYLKLNLFKYFQVASHRGDNGSSRTSPHVVGAQSRDWNVNLPLSFFLFNLISLIGIR